MIQFKQFLLEARDAPLYHGTIFEYANKIIKDNEISAATSHNLILRAGKNKEDYGSYAMVKGVSLSRNKGASEYFGRKGVVFELDQRLLRQNYKITPVNYFATGSKRYKSGTPARYTYQPYKNLKWDKNNEFEEFVNGPIKNVSKYIIRIHIDDANYELLNEKSHEYSELWWHPKLFMNGKFVNEY